MKDFVWNTSVQSGMKEVGGGYRANLINFIIFPILVSD